MEDKTISLISRWKLLNGCPEALKHELDRLAYEVKSSEPGTLMYNINLQARAPLDTYYQPIEPSPGHIPLALQSEVIFIEVYRNAAALSEHIHGHVFNSFKERNLKYFQPDPMQAGWPITETTFLTLQSGFIRHSIE